MKSNVLVVRADSPMLDRQTFQSMLRFRTKVFYERMGWEVPLDKGLDKDRFDDANPVYILYRSPRNEVEGCWRILPTEGPNMLRDTFPQLLGGQPAPCGADVWELSRFAVSPRGAAGRGQMAFHPVAFHMMQQAIDFADQQGISRYVTVTAVSLERILKRIGISLQRLGDGKAQWIGRTLTVACQLEVNEQSRAAVARYLQETGQPVEAA